MKRFYVQHNIGHARYVVSFHDGAKCHSDGSDFFDVRIFKNKRMLASFTKQLLLAGYTEN